MISYRISSVEGYTERIGELVSMLEHTRAITLKDISDLTQMDLDYLTDAESNSIGALLMHIASIEFVHQVITFEERDINSKELLKWQAALELGHHARETIWFNHLDFYLNELALVRERTLSQLKSYSDDWLFEERQWDNGVRHNYYYLWFHVLEDEISHRGQIRIIKRKLQQHN
ncbi:DUF664 domain-containing protein [Bacillus sp. ISL-45]|uniref:DinB family protein n=1 Tax=Bacillus sp. ISL-45 TaxID=2819128 RepID=UPI001BECA101|nr:DUF664 domain-containing protein [Bacillus sp. ISL-45]MBT2663418.1 DUF664 domain-containing protein [Bacillus sp. ISL-45]